jgi:hypothetical protein
MAVAAATQSQIASGNQPARPYAEFKIEGVEHQAVFHGQPLKHAPLLPRR